MLDDGTTVGQIKRISSGFSFSAPNEFFRSNIRMRTDLEPHGCLGDLGWYCIRVALWVMEWTLPRQVTGRILSQQTSPHSPVRAITEFAGELFFEGGVSSTFYCSFLTGLDQWAHISGTCGFLHVPDFVLPFAGSETAFETASPVHNVQGCNFAIQPHTRHWAVSEYSHSHQTAQETNLFQDFVEQVQSGKLDHSWPEIALKTQQVMEACRDSALAGGRLLEISTSTVSGSRLAAQSE